MPPIQDSSTYVTSWISSGSMSTTGGGLFGLPVFEAERGLYVEDETGSATLLTIIIIGF